MQRPYNLVRPVRRRQPPGFLRMRSGKAFCVPPPHNINLKNVIEKEKQLSKSEVDDAKAQTDAVSKAKVTILKKSLIYIYKVN